MSSAFVRYSLVTPKRPDAICLTFERRSGSYRRSGSSPPSPVFDRPPRRFIAIARVSWASAEMEPYDIAPVLKRLTISLTGSTSSSGTAGRSPSRSSRRPRSVMSREDCSSTRCVYSRKMSNRRSRVECWRRKTVSGSNRCSSLSRRHWYSPPVVRRTCGRWLPERGYASTWRAATSAATTSSPMPLRRDVVPVKNACTRSCERPTASKTWAPR
ncbi:Uncharacterised protein [Mycobacteroides abscessus]|nr:Uncharacterised protein [Mycobacteroides abscessus]